MDTAFQTRGQIQTATNKNKHKKHRDSGRRGVGEATSLTRQREGPCRQAGSGRRKCTFQSVGKLEAF